MGELGTRKRREGRNNKEVDFNGTSCVTDSILVTLHSESM